MMKICRARFAISNVKLERGQRSRNRQITIRVDSVKIPTRLECPGGWKLWEKKSARHVARSFSLNESRRKRQGADTVNSMGYRLNVIAVHLIRPQRGKNADARAIARGFPREGGKRPSPRFAPPRG